MHFRALMASFLSLATLVGCGEDLARKQKSKNTGDLTRDTPTATADSGLTSSHMHRSRGFAVLSYTQEIEHALATTLPAAYRIVPDLYLDDEGTNTKNVITMNMGRPDVGCGTGTNFTGTEARIADCLTKNGDKSIWSGQLYGASGESTWKLVALTDSGKEMWTDLRTGMIWSDVVASANWCKASGNKQTANPASTVNCSTIGEDQNLCFSIEGLGTDVRWRLPTRNDYLQADINGLRFVMKSNSVVGAWTATVQAASEDREHAWVYHITDGTLSAQEIISDRHVRCLGAPLR